MAEEVPKDEQNDIPLPDERFSGMKITQLISFLEIVYTSFGYGKIRSKTYQELFSAAIRVEQRKRSRVQTTNADSAEEKKQPD